MVEAALAWPIETQAPGCTSTASQAVLDSHAGALPKCAHRLNAGKSLAAGCNRSWHDPA
jgi:hypothetical protein